MRRQHGVISLRQAASEGVTRHAVAHLVSTGRWLRRYQGVYISVAHRQERLTEWAAALMWVGGGLDGMAALSGPSAASLLKLPDWGLPYRLQLTSPRTQRQPRGDARLVVSRPVSWDRRRDTCLVSGLRVTTVPRTVLDVVAGLDPDPAVGFVAAVVNHRRTSLPDLEAQAQACPRAWGVQKLTTAIEALEGGHDALSELRASRILSAEGIRTQPQYPVQLPFAEVHIDLAALELKVAIEVDGPSHDTMAQRERDIQRDEALRELGWGVVRVTPNQLRTDPQQFVRRVLAEARRLRRGGAAS